MDPDKIDPIDSGDLDNDKDVEVKPIGERMAEFFAEHEARLKKHLPETFHRFDAQDDEGPCFYLGNDRTPWRSDKSRWLNDAEAAIFIEHAARRVLEEEGFTYKGPDATHGPITRWENWSLPLPKFIFADERWRALNTTWPDHLTALMVAVDATKPPAEAAPA